MAYRLEAGTISGLSNVADVAAAGCAPSSFVLHAGTAPGLSNVAVMNMGTSTSLTVVVPPGTYYVRVFAQNAFGVSGPSNEVVVTR